MSKKEVKNSLFEKVIGTLKEWHHDEEASHEEVFNKWYRDCRVCVPEEFSENLYERIIDKFYVILDAVREVLAEEGEIELQDTSVTVMPSFEDTTFSVLTWKNIVLARFNTKAWSFYGMSREEFEEMLYNLYRVARDRIRAFKGLEIAVKELENARCNAEKCPEHAEVADGITELEHVDIHVDGAMTYLESFLKHI